MSSDAYDYVIVGGGTAGCIVAARLSEDPAVRVCLLEAGPSDVGDDAILILNRWMHLLDSGYDWDYPVEPQERGNSFLRHARAKVLGGCSSHNSCIAFWPPAEGLDEWAAMGATGWDAASVLPYVTKLENNDAEGDRHGHDGPVRLRDVPPVDPCGRALLASAAAVGLPTVAFNRGETVRQGAGWFQINAGEDGLRMSSSHAYLHPVLGRENLDVRTDCRVSEIVIDDRLVATGVRYQRPDRTGHDLVTARREVVVTAGAIDTPKLLMLSGIGPADHLAEVGIGVRVASPGVGANLDDHVEGLVFWEAARPMVTESSQWWEIGLFATTEPGLDQPDLMMHYGSVPFDLNTLRHGFPTTDNGFCLTPNVTQGRSRGTVRLRSRDYRDRPRVDPRYFTDPDGHDDRVMLAGVRLAREIAAQPPLSEWIARELAPGPEITSDEDLLDYIHRTHNTVYHPAGTVRMGASDDDLAPLDPQLRVKGVDHLRVVDASAMPKLPAVNPNITVMMMAERAADLIKAASASDTASPSEGTDVGEPIGSR